MKLFLVVCGVLFLAAMFLRVYGDLFATIPHQDLESLKNYYRQELAALKEMNRELTLRLSEMQERVTQIARERDSLQEDKSQLLFMLEKLEKRSNLAKTASSADEGLRQFARAWLIRVGDLKSSYVQEGATPRDALIEEVNEIIQGLKEDFSGDAVISKIDYCTITSNVKKDIAQAQETLARISASLRAYYPPGEEESSVR